MGLGVSHSQPPDMNSVEAQTIRKTVSENCVVIYSKTYCPHCKDAKKIFGTLGVPFQVIELDQMKECQNMQDILGHMTNARTVPRVFINGECIGGASETKALYKQGALENLIGNCGR